MEETEYVPIGFPPRSTEPKGNRRDGVGAVLVLVPPPLLDSVVPPDSKP